MVFPYAMCWRHHLELQLKATAALLHRLLGNPQLSLQRTHDLTSLWEDVAQLIRTRWPEDAAELPDVTRVIEQFSTMDPNGQGFRYRHDVKGNLTLEAVDQIDLPSFHRALCGVSTYLGAVETHTLHELELAREMGDHYQC